MFGLLTKVGQACDRSNESLGGRAAYRSKFSIRYLYNYDVQNDRYSIYHLIFSESTETSDLYVLIKMHTDLIHQAASIVFKLIVLSVPVGF